MSPPDPLPRALPSSTVLANSAWLHRLALRLVTEPAGAADAAQETLRKALERPPRATVPVRRWLAAVLRNVVRQERRGSARRAEREQARPAASAGEPADELAARLELHAQLLAAVRALGEPYRTTVALRYLEDVPVRAIAARMEVPEKTVYTRLERALGELRARLDRAHGRRAAWAGLLLPHASPPAPPASPVPLVAPLLAMSTLWKWTGACAALAAAGFLAVRVLTPHTLRGPSPTTVAAAPVPVLDAPARPGLEVAQIPTERRAEVAAPAPPRAQAPAASAAEPPAVPSTVVGYVRDLELRPVAGLEVFSEPVSATPSRAAAAGETLALAPSAPDGRFELPQPAGAARILARGLGLATLLAPVLAGPPPPEPPTVIVGPERHYAGRVVDAQGTPLAGVELQILLARELARTLQPGIFAGALPLALAVSDEQGRFFFAPVGGAPESRLSAEAPGFAAAQLVLPEFSSSELLLVLTPAERAPNTLAGRVLLADGRPAPGAHVSAGRRATVRTDAAGTFTLALEEGEVPTRLVAVAEGHLPGELELAGLAAERRQDLELVLGAEALVLRGRVEDGAGNPVADAQVWTDDGEYFGEVTTRLGQIDFMLSQQLESMMAGDGDHQRSGRRTRSDAQGRFELKGLLPRRYALQALDPRSYELAGPREASAGTEVVLTLPGEARERVAGRVLSFSGEPLVGAHVGVERVLRVADGMRTYRPTAATYVTTDAAGRFEFPALCTAGTRLLVSSTDAPREEAFALADQPSLTDLDLRCAATCHLRVHLADPERAQTLELRDEHDRPLELTFQIGGVLCSSQAVQIQDGISDLLTSDERARVLVLWKDGEESERIPVRLVPGELNELRP